MLQTDGFLQRKTFHFTKKDLIDVRSSTDGFQPKFHSKDGKYFIKAQAVIGGTLMNDWMVEIIASGFCKTLDIPCISQCECDIVYNDHVWKGVYSNNFEKEGYTFISFERLLNMKMETSKTDEFNRMSTVEKLRWCAGRISMYAELPYDRCETYMLNLAILDCLVGNCDRHTRNFGVFFNNSEGEFSIAPVFDSGMGLFEHDYYRDKYSSYDAAMGNVYVAPYGEDPFEMIDILADEFDFGEYPFEALRIPEKLPNKYSEEYLIKMLGKVKRL